MKKCTARTVNCHMRMEERVHTHIRCLQGRASSTKTEHFFCVVCVTLKKSVPSGTKTEQFFCVACVTLATWRMGYGTTSQKCRATHPVVYRLQKWSKIFNSNNLLIAKFPQPTSHISNTVDKLNKSRLTGLVNIFTLVLPLVRWWWCCCCLFLWQWTTVS
jgi:hypothetical protein